MSELALVVLDTFNVLKYWGPAFQIAAWDTQLFCHHWPACAAKLLHFTLEYYSALQNDRPLFGKTGQDFFCLHRDI